MQLDDLSLDFGAVSNRTTTLQDQFAGVTVEMLLALTAEIYDRIDTLLDQAPQLTDETVVFVPVDSRQEDPTQPGWTLGHIIVHLTASLEENAQQGTTLARGAELVGRPRYETPWEEVTTVAQVRQRLAESRRMTNAFLAAWPDQPHLDNLYEHPYFGPTNAISFHTVGIFHGRGHLIQIEDILQQTAA